MSIPTQSEVLMRLLERLRLAEEDAYTLSHLAGLNSSGTTKDQALKDGWFAVGELLKRMVYQCTELAKGKLQ